MFLVNRLSLNPLASPSPLRAYESPPCFWRGSALARRAEGGAALSHQSGQDWRAVVSGLRKQKTCPYAPVLPSQYGLSHGLVALATLSVPLYLCAAHAGGPGVVQHSESVCLAEDLSVET